MGKTLEQGLMEVLEEEELANLRAHQDEYDQIRAAELAEHDRARCLKGIATLHRPALRRRYSWSRLMISSIVKEIISITTEIAAAPS